MYAGYPTGTYPGATLAAAVGVAGSQRLISQTSALEHDIRPGPAAGDSGAAAVPAGRLLHGARR